MILRADSIRVMCPLFQAGEGGSTPTSALSLWLERCDFGTARALNRLWHSTLPRLGIGSVPSQPYLCWVACHGGIAYGVSIWSPPVARALPRDWLELRRLAIAPDAPRNTASRMLGIMARLIRRELPAVAVLVSYQDTEAHGGAIYRAAGWTPTVLATRKHWDSAARHRPDAQRPTVKRRWEKRLRGEA